MPPVDRKYAYYGATVYPGFEFFRRTFDLQLGPALAASLHAPAHLPSPAWRGGGPSPPPQPHPLSAARPSQVVLLSGACATVVACLGVCPAEVVRIRMVSRPEAYGGGTPPTETLLRPFHDTPPTPPDTPPTACHAA